MRKKLKQIHEKSNAGEQPETMGKHARFVIAYNMEAYPTSMIKMVTCILQIRLC